MDTRSLLYSSYEVLVRLGLGEGPNSQSLGNNCGPMILTLLVNGIPAYNLTSKVNSQVLNFMGTWGLKASTMAVNSVLTCFSNFHPYYHCYSY